MNTVGTTLLTGSCIWFIYLVFSALELLYRHPGQIRLRFFGLGSGVGIIVLSVGWFIVSGMVMRVFILFCFGVVLLWMFIPKRASHPNSGHL